jgi:hypothetical protein
LPPPVVLVVAPDVIVFVLELVLFPPAVVVVVVPGPEVELLVVPPSGGLSELNISPPHPSKKAKASTSKEVLDFMWVFSIFWFGEARNRSRMEAR